MLLHFPSYIAICSDRLVFSKLHQKSEKCVSEKENARKRAKSRVRPNKGPIKRTHYYLRQLLSRILYQRTILQFYTCYKIHMTDFYIEIYTSLKNNLLLNVFVQVFILIRTKKRRAYFECNARLS